MKVLLDGRFLTESEDIAGAVDAARRVAAGGRLIVGAALDGRDLSPDELADGRGLRGREVAISTAATGELATAAVEAAARGLEQARECQAETARLIHEGSLAGCAEPLSGMLRLWQHARDAADLTIRLLNEKDASELGEQARGLSEELAGCLGEVKRSLASEDWSALADTLAYDLDALAEQWSGFLETLGSRVATSGAPSP